MSEMKGGRYNVVLNGTVAIVYGPDGRPVPWKEVDDLLNAARPEGGERNAALEEAAKACENIYAGDEAPGDWPTPEQCAAAIRKLKLSTPQTPRDSALDEIEKLIGAVEGRHFALIETATSEDDKRRHGTKVAFAMELRSAIRALKSKPPMNSGLDSQLPPLAAGGRNKEE